MLTAPRDVLSALKVVSNIFDELAWMRYLQLWDNIGPITATKLIDVCLERQSIDECINYFILKGVYDKSLYITLEKIKYKRNSPSEAIMIALDEMDSMLERQFKEEWLNRKKDFILLTALAKNHSTISEFIAEYILDPQMEELSVAPSDPKDGVILSTIHSAKGLEADFCYVLDVSVASYPNSRSIDKGLEDVEEERRVLYVALTRAKNELFITRNITAIDKIERSSEEPTKYFLTNIPDDIYNNMSPESNPKNTNRGPYCGGKIANIDFNINTSQADTKMICPSTSGNIGYIIAWGIAVEKLYKTNIATRQTLCKLISSVLDEKNQHYAETGFARIGKKTYRSERTEYLIIWGFAVGRLYKANISTRQKLRKIIFSVLNEKEIQQAKIGFAIMDTNSIAI